jgi:hypothetical protein
MGQRPRRSHRGQTGAGRSTSQLPHLRSAGSPRRGLLHAVGGGRRCGVLIVPESGELPIPGRPHVCLMIDEGAAGVPHRCLGVHQGYHLVVLSDEISRLECREVESRGETAKPAQDGFRRWRPPRAGTGRRGSLPSTQREAACGRLRVQATKQGAAAARQRRRTRRDPRCQQMRTPASPRVHTRTSRP